MRFLRTGQSMTISKRQQISAGKQCHCIAEHRDQNQLQSGCIFARMDNNGFHYFIARFAKDFSKMTDLKHGQKVHPGERHIV